MNFYAGIYQELTDFHSKRRFAPDFGKSVIPHVANVLNIVCILPGILPGLQSRKGKVSQVEQV